MIFSQPRIPLVNKLAPVYDDDKISFADRLQEQSKFRFSSARKSSRLFDQTRDNDSVVACGHT